MIALAVTVSFLVGLLIGLGTWYRSKSTLEKQKQTLELELATLRQQKDAETEKLRFLESADSRLREAFTALATDALRANAEAFGAHAKTGIEAVVSPLATSLSTLEAQIRALETARVGAYESMQQQILGLKETHTLLHGSTTALVNALKNPTARGRWGEIQLRRVLEMADMVEHVSFDEQVRTEAGRPDVVVHLPNGGCLPVDSKVPLDAYLSAMGTTDERRRNEHLAEHARALRGRARELGQRQYWEQFGRAPEFVIMFLPNEACLGAAFEADPELLDYAIDHKVLVTSPVNLLALLKAVAYGWQQHQITENTVRIAGEARELSSRLGTFVDHFREVGKQLGRSVESYNDASGSLARRLIPSAQRFADMGISNAAIEAPSAIDITPQLPEGLPDAEREERKSEGEESEAR